MTTVEQASKFVTWYLNSQTTGMRAYERDGVCYIVTPYYRADGNRIAVEVQILDEVGAPSVLTRCAIPTSGIPWETPASSG